MAATNTLTKAATPEQINKHIIDNLGGSMEAHLKDKHIYHDKGLPFYTCIGNNEWTKEFPNGETHLVHIDIDLKTFEEKESLIRKLTPATKKTATRKIK